MREVYVVAVPQTGGCWCASSKCYASWDAAQEALDKDRAAGIDYTQIFTLYVEA